MPRQIYRNFEIEDQGHGCFVAAHVEFTGDDEDTRAVSSVLGMDGIILEVDTWYANQRYELMQMLEQGQSQINSMRVARDSFEEALTEQLRSIQAIGRMVHELDVSAGIMS